MPPQKIPPVIWIVLGLLLLFSFFSILIAIHNPSGRSYPQMVQSAQPEPVDYAKITKIVQHQISLLPTPQNGVNGKDGVNGTNGTTGATGKTGSVGVAGAQGSPGPQGEPGATGKSIQLRYNATKAQIEYRYDGDITWNILVTICTLTNACGP